MKVVIHGAGPSGCTAARVLAEQGHMVEVYEVRDEIGGNTYDHLVDNTVIHKYGPHLFHTDSDKVWEFLSRFTEWVPYIHTVKARTSDGIIDLPIVDTSLSKPISVLEHPDSDKLYNLVYRDYSLKQWGYQPPKEVLNRVMIKDKKQEGYFIDKYQALPKNGYTAMFTRMLRHPNIKVYLKCNSSIRPDCDLRIWTGPIDEYFNYKYGDLKYRSLDITLTLSLPNKIATTINECTLDRDYTRSTDYSMLPVNSSKIYPYIQREYPCDYIRGINLPFYPMNDKLIDKYKSEPTNTIFVGRLAEYKYYDMDKAILNILDRFED